MSESGAPATVPAGWYEDRGMTRWWDGQQWGPYMVPQPVRRVEPIVPAPVQAQYAGRTANKMPVSYTRQQKGHSITVWIILSLFLVFPVIGLIYYSVSPNHYWHF